ncbi:MAG: isoamylase [Waddliaceae bacterium]
MDTTFLNERVSQGAPSPFGVSQVEEGINFALHSKHAENVRLCLFYFDTGEPFAEIPLDPNVNRTGDSWHICIKELPERLVYGYRISKEHGRPIKKFYKPEKIVLDPYAKAVNTSNQWGKDGIYNPLGLVIPKDEFDWEDDRPLEMPLNELVINEMHVRAFTQHNSSGVQNKGKYLGLVEKIPYLKDLGINAVKLMPIHEFNEMEFDRYNPLTGERLVNFWGYSTVNFFSPMNRYCVSEDFGASILEFKSMVKAFHKAGIEVILDVVFNHTAEGNEVGPVISFKGIDCPVYYILDKKHQMQNFSGCGNTFNCNHPVVREFILTCLRYWVVEMHVDGFRFDLAAIMCRGIHGEPMSNPPLIEQISHDPILSKTKLFAEPWDSGGVYILGGFHSEEDRWSEWNDKYRGAIRGFIKGDMGVKREFAIRICGSNDLFGDRSPTSSVNFITAHDGFTLRDLVSYNDKHNTGNSEDNRDGNSNTCSWNCGFEGETDNADVLILRQKQMRNFHLALMISLGVPMLTMGNEYGHTRGGNNNAWCQDNELNWFLWDEIEKNADFFRFYKEMIYFRRRHPVFNSSDFYSTEDVIWHSKKPFEPDWDGDTKVIAVTMKEEDYLFYIAFNTHMNEVTLELPPAPDNQGWHFVVNTANAPPEDFFNEENAPALEGMSLTLQSNSAVLLISKGTS